MSAATSGAFRCIARVLHGVRFPRSNGPRSDPGCSPRARRRDLCEREPAGHAGRAEQARRSGHRALRGEEPHELKVNVLLPDGYRNAQGVSAALPHARRGREPPLVGGPGARRRGEDARRSRRDHRDARGRPRLLHELVERRRARRPGLGALPPRRGHPAARASASRSGAPAAGTRSPGFSMAGFGSSFLATQRPGYFGTLVPMSGLVSIRRPEVEQGLSRDQRRALPRRVGPVGRVLRGGARPDHARAEPEAHEGDPAHRQRRAAAGGAGGRDATLRAARSRLIC